MAAQGMQEIKVRFRFKNDKKSYRGIMTREQFENFKILPVVDLCEIVEELGIKVDEQTEKILKERLEKAFAKKTHVRNLSYD